MEDIGLQQWNQKPAPPSREQRQRPHHEQRRRSRGGRDRRRSDDSCERRAPPSSINNARPTDQIPQARATRENLHTLTQLQSLYTLQLQLQGAHDHQIGGLERQVADACGRLLQDAQAVEQQVLVNTHGLGPVSRERLGALGTQISAMIQRLY